MLFKKETEPCCGYCKHGVSIGGGEVMCLRKGIVSSSGQCGRFSYDPLKRRPPVQARLKTDELTQADFKIE